jgi:hypothetical protein
MIGLFLLFLAVTGIARMARTRGASSWPYGVIAGVGWFVIGVLAAVLLPALGFESRTGELSNGGTFIATILPWAFIGLVALYVRFRIGRGVEGPTGSWTCRDCRTLNQNYALKCDSCGAPFVPHGAV